MIATIDAMVIDAIVEETISQIVKGVSDARKNSVICDLPDRVEFELNILEYPTLKFVVPIVGVEKIDEDKVE